MLTYRGLEALECLLLLLLLLLKGEERNFSPCADRRESFTVLSTAKKGLAALRRPGQPLLQTRALQTTLICADVDRA